ncbi:DUF721 domain-containing protein [bacterium]|nr:DUF721 domain-containing protein [bacterium]
MNALSKRKIRICPIPDVWNKIYEDLMAFWEKKKLPEPPPPTPLILGGWAYSNDIEKHERWTETVRWATNNGCAHLLESLSESDYHRVNEMSSFEIGPGGGPLYLAWNSEARTKPDEALLSRALRGLQEHWSAIVGTELAKITYPVSFTGEKRRRLLVFAEPSTKPSWGEWNKLDKNENRQAFSRFRKAVNKAIHPHEVDHIDFIHKRD